MDFSWVWKEYNAVEFEWTKLKVTFFEDVLWSTYGFQFWKKVHDVIRFQDFWNGGHDYIVLQTCLL